MIASPERSRPPAGAGGLDSMSGPTIPLPQMLTELALSSWETIAYRSVLMASGGCSLAEYANMVSEKLGAVQCSTLAMLSGGSLTAMVAPWHGGATANAKRLRGF